MFAIVRTGGKQYRVAPGDKIVVEKLSGEAGDNVELADVLLAGDGGDLKSTSGLTVAARIVAQAKADKVTVFKKKRRHNYRRKRGHRQQHTILEIVSIGGQKAQKGADKKPAAAASETPAAPEAKPAKAPKAAPSKVEGAAKAASAPEASTSDAAPAKSAASKPAKGKDEAAKPAKATKKK